MLPVVRAMAKLGATDVEIAQALQVGLSTIELWARQHPEFLRALKPPKGVADDRVERSLFKLATGYSYDSEELFPYDHIETRLVKTKDGKTEEVVLVKEKRVRREPVVKHVPPHPTAGIFWLKNRRKEKWRAFKSLEVSTPPGRPFEHTDPKGGEADLIGAYYERLARQKLGATAKTGRPARSDPGADPGVDPGGQGPDGPPGDPEADQG